MKKNAFTLIELLAVILILGIIALIAIPTVTNIIKESKRGAFKASVQNIIGAVETECQLEQMRGEELTTSYTFTNGSIDNELNIKGDLPQSGTITVNSSCNVEVDVTDGTFTAIKSFTSDELHILEVKVPKTFAEDDWSTIIEAVKNGNINAYNVGDIKEVTLSGDVAGTYKVRIANISTPEECNVEGFSQTACGFVIEFEDIITEHTMNSERSNEGGWQNSEMRTYVNDTIYNALPPELKEGIVETTVVSGHGPTNGEANFITMDKVYLLSTKEVWGSNSLNDSASDATRQLDYYVNKGVTTSGYSDAVKYANEVASIWWLRSVSSSSVYYFYIVPVSGNDNTNFATAARGVSPAFRIG